MKLTLSQIRKGIFYLILVVLASGFSYRLGQTKTVNNYQQRTSSQTAFVTNPRSTGNGSQLDLSLFWQVYDKVTQTYLNRSSIDKAKLINGAIGGMVSALGDPYTVYLPPTDNEEVKGDLRGDFEGVGIQIGYNAEKKVSVIAPLSGTPAEKAGIKAGDVVVKINDEKAKVDKTTEGLSLPEVVDLIRGPKGTTVKLLLARGEQTPFEIALKRDTIVVKSVELKTQKNNGKTVAILKLSRFGDRTEDEWKDAVVKINQERNLAGVILDLRNNPGGYLEGSVFIGSEFISDGVIVRQDSGSGIIQDYPVNRKGSLLKTPLVVLINGGSASAAEIVAGSLQEKNRAKLVGEKSFGKGTVQQAEDLEGGGGLHITIARWLLPSGKSIDKEGVMPDFEVKNDENDMTKDAQLTKALEIL